MVKALKVEGLSKAYQLGDFGTGTISRDIERFIARLSGKEDPFLRIGEINDRTTKSESDIVWSLNDLNFEVAQGDAVGIIGNNGAGKSTLLKILSRITSPTTGIVKVKGRVASLLEVGTGFHPELTGRENIFLNGAILGMRKKEIKLKFDEIVDFSGVERYIDTPVKRYSSGMYVRLAFAVAAYLESEILIVDEVLAVGDAEFQKKCLGKMGDISAGEGRTVLFVSHNLESIRILCSKGIYLKNGTLKDFGEVGEIVKHYQQDASRSQLAYYQGEGIIKSAIIESIAGGLLTYNCAARIIVRIATSKMIEKVVLGIKIKTMDNVPVLSVNNRNYYEQSINKKGMSDGMITIDFQKLPLFPGEYLVNLFLGDTDHDIEVIPDAFRFQVHISKINPVGQQIKLDENKVFSELITWRVDE